MVSVLVHINTHARIVILVLVWDFTQNGLAHLYVKTFGNITAICTDTDKHTQTCTQIEKDTHHIRPIRLDWNEKKILCISLYTLKEAFLVFSTIVVVGVVDVRFA